MDKSIVLDPAAELDRHYDVIVIGSGAGGSSLACRLGELGQRVLVIERGSALIPRRRNASDQVGQYLFHLVAERDEPLSFVGGETKFYGSALYRLRESDFKQVEHESGVSPAWPITYSDLEPYYGQAEALYRVHGSPDGDPSEPSRTGSYPYPPLEHAPVVLEMVRRLRASGTNVAAIPRGLDYRPGGRCVLCPTCDGYYCQLDAKMDAEIAALRPALATGKVRLATETECLRVLTSQDGKYATGVQLRRAGAEVTVNAGAVVVSAGLPRSALLLRRSRTDKHPDGLGNTTGVLGRYLAGHSTGIIFPFLGWKKVPPIHSKTFAINEYYDGAPDWPYPTGVIQVAGQMPFWELAPPLIRPIARFVGEHSLKCFYMTEALPTRDTGLFFAGDTICRRVGPLHNQKTFAKLRRLAIDIFRRAGYRALALRLPPFVWHEVGTARLGSDPATSVVDPNCQVHGIERLYVVDASVLPSAGAVNTGLTIIALALRLGDHLAAGSLDLRKASQPDGRQRSRFVAEVTALSPSIMRDNAP